MKAVIRCGLGFGIVLMAATSAQAVPSIAGNAHDGRCLAALGMAKAAYRAPDFSVDWPIHRPAGPDSRIIFQQNDADLSGGDAVSAEPTEFTALPQSAAGGGKIYWGRHASAGKRLVITEESVGWRGDWYSLYLVGADQRPQLFARQYTAQSNAESGALKPALGGQRWNPPIILTSRAPAGYWVIDRGEPYEVMPDWRVFAVGHAGLKPICRIAFGAAARAGLAALPTAVRKLAADLDEALGPGSDEGTLQQTASIRNSVDHASANAAVRPWALTAEPYNSRSEVDAGLAAWARDSRPRTALLKRVASDYPAAKRALAAYYAAHPRRHFGRSAADADHVLDILFRSYFVFSKRS